MALTGAMQVLLSFFFGKLNRNGWPVPLLTTVEGIFGRGFPFGLLLGLEYDRVSACMIR